jgi:hypothetical protein
MQDAMEQPMQVAVFHVRNLSLPDLDRRGLTWLFGLLHLHAFMFTSSFPSQAQCRDDPFSCCTVLMADQVRGTRSYTGVVV